MCVKTYVLRRVCVITFLKKKNTVEAKKNHFLQNKNCYKNTIRIKNLFNINLTLI